ncbi:hypothetical protein SAMN02745248_01717 [Hathewaya proteolytica DSM 3090]|uniref:CAAX prenyl protease 2/Lysostaphin resistance protein A-like domain-containing protein n=1 Tax=Hathewaya proteolytica DSM 3090 TaxID=1121331 RepID=A0A1M6PIU3_9CLOT|nr:type II CAAX endopeptidase family protein [Hathewaya proteolytica]SHK07837.1 hypothetical protein SAMN02745248_01717 [Hathewaya proteolytica DSM 3090]
MKRIFKSNLLFLSLTISFILFQKALPIILKLVKTNDIYSMIYPIQLVGTFIFLWLPAIIYILIHKNKSNYSIKESLKLKKTGFNNLAFSFLAFLCLEPIAMFLNTISTYFIPNNVGDFVSTLSSNGSVAMLFFTIAIVPAIGEELVFRGIIADGYKTRTLTTIALINGLLFGIFHMNPCQFLYAFVLGVVFTYVVEYTGSIFCSMLIHFLFNGFSCTMAIIAMSNPDLFSEEVTKAASNAMSFSKLAFLFIIAMISSILLYMILKKLRFINRYDEKKTLRFHVIELVEDTTADEFVEMPPKKAMKIAYLPLAISIGLYIGFVFKYYIIDLLM